ncbi:anthranilate synthase component I family protein [Paenibacillus lemnae]|uniref:Anthranilate synthase component I family protein n=1 Tax=Paenibacillus lemnae TaxID=1330551 RepID=A0A848MCA4_PAELE|nr:anthranilate synthase component I family protein [Paenibacillus lemnae]NMO97770.1 anthranilate synthase component I family protein [Paenibacillus lemnae]
MENTVMLDDWLHWVKEGWTMLPLLAKSSKVYPELPETWKKAWQTSSPYSFVLESGKGGRYTYLGLEPVSVLTGKGTAGQVRNLMTGDIQKLQGKPLHLLKEWMEPYRSPRVPGWPDFQGGCAGFLGYDVIRTLEQLPALARDDAGFPDYLWMRMEEVWIYDHHEQALYCAVHSPWDHEHPSDRETLTRLYHQAEDRLHHMLSRWDDFMDSAVNEGRDSCDQSSRRLKAQSLLGPDVAGWDALDSDFSQEAFEQAVRSIQEYIRNGDVFQVNLSLRRKLRLKSDPADVYEWLRILNPSPYMGYITSPDFKLASGSPELLVKLAGDRVSARPIAGTRRRGASPEEDAAMETELLHTEKERAEHIMLVDLERNDIGRIAAYGSVHVPELMTIERYSHVMHLVSQVEGRLACGKQAYDVIAATFPGGTITGAPKIRTMEIIEELEPVTRGPYTGSMGWIDYNGDMELNIIIRTLAVQDGIGYIQAGAGIVIDSDPYREYRECHNKAKALIAAVMCSEEETASAALT